MPIFKWLQGSQWCRCAQPEIPPTVFQLAIQLVGDVIDNQLEFRGHTVIQGRMGTKGRMNGRTLWEYNFCLLLAFATHLPCSNILGTTQLFLRLSGLFCDCPSHQYPCLLLRSGPAHYWGLGFGVLFVSLFLVSVYPTTDSASDLPGAMGDFVYGIYCYVLLCFLLSFWVF